MTRDVLLIHAAASLNEADQDHERHELPATFARLVPMGLPVTIAHLPGVAFAYWLYDEVAGQWRGVGVVGN